MLGYGLGFLAFACFLAFLPYVEKVFKYEEEEREEYQPTLRERIWHRALLIVGLSALITLILLAAFY